MSKIYINPDEDLFEILEQIYRGIDRDVEVMIDTTNPILNNSLNLKYIETEAGKVDKQVTFVPKDEKGREIIESFYKQDLSLQTDTAEVEPEIQTEMSKPNFQGSSGFVQGDILEENKELVKATPSKKKLDLSGLVLVGGSAKNFQRIFKIITIILLLTIPIGLFIVWWFLPVANIKLTLKAESLDQSFTLKVSADVKEADIKQGLFPAQLLSAQKLARDTAIATGLKTIGEKASGVITISNKTPDEKEFPAGTLVELISGETLGTIQFTTTERITVAGSNAGIVGKSDVSITADEIGEDYNLTSGRLFNIGSFDSTDYVAKNDNSITGGVSKQVTVVTQSDQDKLLESIKVKLDKQVKDDLTKKAEGKGLAQNSVKLTVVEKIFSANVGTEVDDFSLELTMKAEGLVIDESTIKKLEEEIKPNLPDGYKMLDSKGVFTFDVIDSATAPQIVIQYKAKMGKDISVDDLKTRLIGKTTDEAQSIIKSIEEVSEYSIRITPKLPPFLTRMPRQKSRININLEYK